MEGTDARERDEHGNEVVRDEDAPGMLDDEAQQEEVEPDDGPSPAQDFGKIIHVKQGATVDPKDVADADIVIEDQVVPMIISNRNGIAGVIAAPEILDQAEVIE